MDRSVDEMVRMLWDLDEIKVLKARYFRFLDTREWEQLARLFTPDCTFVYQDIWEVDGPDAFIAKIRRLICPGTSVHVGHMPEIEIHDSERASGIWSMSDFLEVHRGSEVHIVRGYGHYHESYVKADGRWLIAAWRLTRLRVDHEVNHGVDHDRG